MNSVWTRDFSNDRELIGYRELLERKGFSLRVNEYAVIVTHPALVASWVIHTKAELIRLGKLYGGADAESLSEGMVWDMFDDRRRDPPGRTAHPPHDGRRQNEESPFRDRLAELEAENRRLRERGSLAVKQREEWEKRALAAEARMATSPSLRADKRFDALKRLLAREFHPDQIQGEGLEKILRAEIFKRLWPKVETIENAE